MVIAVNSDDSQTAAAKTKDVKPAATEASTGSRNGICKCKQILASDYDANEVHKKSENKIAVVTGDRFRHWIKYNTG
jgi:hypothetical protein